MQGFRCLTFAVFVVDVVLAAEAAVVATHCDLVVVLVFDAVGTYSVGVYDACVAVAFHLIIAVYLAFVAVLNSNRGIEIHVDVVFKVLPDLQEVLTKLLHLKNQLWSFQLLVLRCRLSFVYLLIQFLIQRLYFEEFQKSNL